MQGARAPAGLELAMSFDLVVRNGTVVDGSGLGSFRADVGIVGDKNVTYLSVSDRGLYLRSHVLFRFMRAPVLVPWSEVKYVSERKVLWSRSYLVDLGGITTIRVRERAFLAMEGFLVGASSTAARQRAPV